MLNFFPTPYEDELWYSVTCRYHKYSGNRDPLQTIRELFKNKAYVDVGTIYPNNTIYQIIKQLPNGFLNEDDIVFKHTIFNYFLRIYDLDEKERLLNDIKKGSVKMPKNPNLIAEKPKLRYCPICRQEELEQYGESYWHMSHQLPLASICMKHKCRLHTFYCKGKKDLDMKLILPDMIEIENPIFKYQVYEYELTELSLQYLYDLFDLEFDKSFNNIVIGLYNKGYYIITKNDWILDHKKLFQDLENYYGDELVKQYFGNKDNAKTISYLKRWITKMPERYLILENFIHQDMKDTFSIYPIENMIIKRFYECKENYIGQTRKTIAEKIGIKEHQVDILAENLKEEKFWVTHNKRETTQLNLKIDVKLKERLLNYIHRNDCKTYSEFVSICIDKELLNREKFNILEVKEEKGDSMLNFNIKVMNHTEAFEYVYGYCGLNKTEDFAMISIQEYPQELMGVVYKPGGHLKQALNLHFIDLDDPVKHKDKRLITDEDVEKIKEFMEELIKKNEIKTLIIHCWAGVSRSAAVAAAILKVYTGNDDQIFKSGTYAPNMYVYHKILEGYGMKNDGSVFKRDDKLEDLCF